MRVFLLLLLLMNIAFFGWHYQQGGFSREFAPVSRDIAQTDAGVPMLVLVSEQAEVETTRSPTPSTVASADAPGAVQSVAPPPPPPVVLAERCVVVGPYAEREGAETALATASRAGIPALLEETEQRVSAGFWLVLEGRYSPAEGRRIIGDMEARGISDTAVTPLEDGSHAISLGIYNRQSSLDVRRRQFTTAGYQTEVIERTRTRVAWNLLLALEAADLTPMSTLIDTLIETDPEIGWRDIECQ